jgi:hypothetical protein
MFPEVNNRVTARGGWNEIEFWLGTGFDPLSFPGHNSGMRERDVGANEQSEQARF